MRVYRLLTGTGAIILLVTAVLKVCESTQQHTYFSEPDSVIQMLTNRQILLLAAVFETIVAIYIWFTSSLTRRSYALLWFCCIVVLYKTGRYYTRAFYPCSCLGVLESWLKLSWRQTDTISWLLLGFLTICSTAWLLRGNHGQVAPQ